MEKITSQASEMLTNLNGDMFPLIVAICAIIAITALRTILKGGKRLSRATIRRAKLALITSTVVSGTSFISLIQQ